MLTVYVITGMALGFYSIVRLNKKISIIKRAYEVKGTVIKIDEKWGGVYFCPRSFPVLHYPNIEYINNQGLVCIYKEKQGYDVIRYSVGDCVDLLIDDKGKRKKVYIKRWLYVWFNDLAIGILSIVLFTGGLYGLSK